MRRIGIAFFYDRSGHVDDYFLVLLDALRPFFDRILVVSNGSLTSGSASAVCDRGFELLMRPDQGFDAAAYKAGMQHLNLATLSFDELILFDSSFFGPFGHFDTLFSRMEAAVCDFWGITALRNDKRDGESNITASSYHLGSYFIAIRHALVESPDFARYWEEIASFDIFEKRQAEDECRFSRYFEKLGFSCAVFIDPNQYNSLDPLLEQTEDLLRDGCPIIKRQSFTLEPVRSDELGLDPIRYIPIISDICDYDTGLIRSNILRTTKLRVLQCNMAMNTIISDAVSQLPACAIRICFCLHIYYVDMAVDLIGLCQAAAIEASFLITTDTQAKADSIASIFATATSAADHTILVMPFNVGGDTSALLICCAPMIMLGRYDLVCRLHTKKSPQDPAAWSLFFRRHLLENLVGSKDHTNSIIRMFMSEPKLGVVMAQTIHVGYSVMGHGWFTNRPLATEIAQKLDLSVELDDYTPVAPFGGMFWFRPEALRKILNHRWDWDDFRRSGPYRDGDLPHAIERLYCYVAQDAGFMARAVMSRPQAEANYARLEFKIQQLAALLPAGNFADHVRLLTRWKETNNVLPAQFTRKERYAVPSPQIFARAPNAGMALFGWIKRIVKAFFRRPGDLMSGHIDLLCGFPNPGGSTLHIRRNSGNLLYVEGWAFNLKRRSEYDEILILLKGGGRQELYFKTSRVKRPDLIKVFQTETANNAGFECWLDPHVIPAGTYSIGLVGLQARRWNDERKDLLTIILDG